LFLTVAERDQTQILFVNDATQIEISMLPHTKSYLMYARAARLIEHWLTFLNIEPQYKLWEIMKICEANFEIILILNVVYDTNYSFKKSRTTTPLKLGGWVLTSPGSESIEPHDKFGEYENL
jgi:hypothetical protein